jgi:hypothetical protein
MTLTKTTSQNQIRSESNNWEQNMTTRTKTPDLLNLLRNWHPSGDEYVMFLENLASNITNAETELSEDVRAAVVDRIDEIIGAIEVDVAIREEEQGHTNDEWQARQDAAEVTA